VPTTLRIAETIWSDTLIVPPLTVINYKYQPYSREDYLVE